MNVLFVIRGNDSYSSQQAQIELISGLIQNKINIFLIGEISEEVKHEIEKKKIAFTPLFPEKKYDKIYAEKLRDFINLNQIDIVHFLDGKALRSGLISLKKHPVKVVVYFGSASLHWYDPTSHLTYLNSRVDKIICNSNFVYHHVKSQLKSKYKHKAVRIFKGYNSNWFQEIEPKDFSELNIPSNALVVAFVGNHRKVKGTKYFIESSFYLKTDKEVHYLVIGNKTNSNSFLHLASKSPMSQNIHFLGKRNDVISILKSCNIYAQTSLSEGFGRAISEAMSVGKPVVMTNAGGCTELIDEHSGIVVPLKNSKAIGNAISKLVNNEQLRKQMGINAKNRIDTVYNIDDTVKETLNLYNQILS